MTTLSREPVLKTGSLDYVVMFALTGRKTNALEAYRSLASYDGLIHNVPAQYILQHA